MFSQNTDYHSSSYNSDFNNIVYNNVCSFIPDFQSDLTGCNNFDEGILQKGIYSSVIKLFGLLNMYRYWNYLEGINHDYLQSNRTNLDQYQYLNDQGMPVADQMLFKYLNISLNLLVNELSTDINSL